MAYITFILALVIIAVLLALIAGSLKLLRSRRRITALDHVKDGHEFEEYIAKLLEDVGFADIEITKMSGDYGADVLACRDDIKYAVQCKFYSQPVGVSSVQEVISGKLYYNCHVGAVVTNNSFTRNAVEMAERANVLLWDINKIEQFEQERKASLHKTS